MPGVVQKMLDNGVDFDALDSKAYEILHLLKMVMIAGWWVALRLIG